MKIILKIIKAQKKTNKKNIFDYNRAINFNIQRMDVHF